MAAAVAIAVATAPDATAVDLHRLWDERCLDCHGHAADLARGGLAPRPDLAAFLRRHRGGQPPEIAAALAAMLHAQAASSGVFAERCRICHRSAAELARDMIVREGVLVGRYSGRPIAEFLVGHGRLDAEGAARMAELLARVEREVHFQP